MIYIQFFISEFQNIMDGQNFSNDFSDESDVEGIPGKEVEADCELEVLRKKSSNNKQQKPMKGQWIVILEKLKKCQQCNIFLLNSNQFVEHQKQHAKPSSEITTPLSEKVNKFKCDFCKNGFQNVTGLREHIKDLHMKVFYEDHKKSIEIQSVSDQRNVSHASNGYKCDHCNNIFVEEDAIKHHKQNCVPANDYKSKAAEKAEELVTAKENKCTKCSKTFKYKDTLKRHFRTEHSGFRYKCNKCDQEFNNSGNMSRHKRRFHKSDKKDIPKSVRNPSLEENTRPIGNSEKSVAQNSHKCGKCDKKYLNKASLLAHIQSIHEGKTHNCQKCDKEFISKTNLNTHNLNIHEGQKHKCETCGKEFPQRSSLTNHIKVMHQELSFKCTDCDKAFFSKLYCQRHISQIHKK